MNNLKIMAIAIAASCASASLDVHAQTTLYNPSWYIAPSVNVMDPDKRFGVDKTGVGGGFRVGKPLSQYWDLQMGTTYAKTDNDNARYQQQTLGVDALYMFSRKSFRPFLLAGTGYERDRATTPLLGTRTRTSPYLNAGAGFQVALGEQWAIQADYRRVFGYLSGFNFGFDRAKTDYVTVGLTYAFDKPSAPIVRTAQAPEPVREVAPTPPPTPVPTPPPAPPAPRMERITLSATELFAFDSAQLRLPQPKLDEVASALNANTSINNVMIIGYADRLGSDKYNQKLSERRAMSVKNYLTGKGIDAGRLKAEGRGEANPVVMCTDKNRPALIKCLEPNRRVEIEQITIERRAQ
jgi:OmpA-OmpF porin, OOP family